MPRKHQKTNVLHQLWQREIAQTRSPYRFSLKILRKLICDKTATFEKVWEAHSKQPITTEDGKLYFNNYETCLTLNGCNGLPSELYRLPSQPKPKKIEDAVVYSGPLNKLSSQVESYKGFFLALTRDNWLNSYDNLTGKEMQSIYLGPINRYKFKHVEWETHGETIALTSIQNQTSLQPSQVGRPRVLVSIAMLSVFPLEFTALLEIDRQIFGNQCNHVSVSEGLLILGFGNATNGIVRLYNFRQIVQDMPSILIIQANPHQQIAIYRNYHYSTFNLQGMLFTAKLNRACDALDGLIVGAYPAGLPLNCKIKAHPPVLFEVRCSDFDLHIGGYPWHYITTPPRREGVFQICSLIDHQMAEGGCLDFPNVSTEPDSMEFHPDDSGRLVYNAAHSIRFYKLFENEKGNKVLKECFVITMEEEENNVQKKVPQRRTQRVIKKKFTLDAVMSCEKSILSDNYENELDLYAVLGFNPHSEDFVGKISLFDNTTGKKIKTLTTNMKMDELSDYNLTMDLETLILIVKNKMRRYSCYIFRLKLFAPHIEDGTTLKHTTQPKKHKKTKRNVNS